MKKSKQKLYCYVDETGQDSGTEFFVVVAVVSDRDQNLIRKQLFKIESSAKIGLRKWHKSKDERKRRFLQLVLEKKIGKGEIYFGRYKKPIPFFLPMLEVLEKSILDKAEENYKAIVYVDGIDKKKASELTSALRVRKIKLEFVRSARDESEPLIRLADRWAGCIGTAFSGNKPEKRIFEKAKEQKYLQKV